MFITHILVHYSHSEIDFLDLTIYKNSIYNRLETRTFQKPANLYQYLHFSSNHPRHLFKAIIIGELIRYIRNSSVESSYTLSTKLFRSRLIKRDYPPLFIDKIVSSISYRSRHIHLQIVKKDKLIKTSITNI